MKLFSTIFSELTIPDDQRGKWYLWSGNQGFHALLGVILGVFFPEAGVQVAVIVALLKEYFDLMQNFSRKAVLDSATDVAFWGVGAWIVCSSTPALPVFILGLMLIAGITVKVREAIKDRRLEDEH